MGTIEAFTKIDFLSWVITAFAILSIGITMYEILVKFSDIIGKPIGWKKARETDHDLILKIQKELTDSQLEISNKMLDISKKIDTIQKNTDERLRISEEKQNKRVQSEIKERIAQSYRRYNISKKISSMELEALEDLIVTYENYGGENSFVHSVVQTEMYTWKIF